MSIINSIKITQSKKTTMEKYKAALIGGVIGSAVGMVDGYYTDLSNKKIIKNALDTYYDFDTESKRNTINSLHKKGIKLKDYQDYAKDLLAKSPVKKMVRNALIYGILFAIAGQTIDKYRSGKKQLH